jgi:hypothetical protein
MKRTRSAVCSGVLALWLCFGIFGTTDVAEAQSVCSCPAGSTNLGGGRCQTISCPAGTTLMDGVCLGGDQRATRPTTTISNGSCRSATPQIGQIAVSQQQLSFSTVAGVLRGRRDELQGTLGSPSTPASPVMGYSPFNLDDNAGLLGYASTGSKNPLYKAPPTAVSTAPTWAAWAEGLGDWERRGALNAFDIGRTQSTYGAHAGFDGTWKNAWLPGDFMVAGLVTSYMATHVDLSGSPATLQLEGPGIGLYAMYVNGGFSADLIGKADFLNLKEDLAGIAPNGSIGVTNTGVSGNLQYKNKIDGGFIEPTIGFSFTRTMFGDTAALMGLQDGSTLRLQGGARFGKTFDVNGISIEPTLALLAYSNVVANGTTLATVAVPVPVTPTDQGLLRGEIDPELNFNFNNGYSAYLRGSVRFGDELVGGFAKIGVRKQF